MTVATWSVSRAGALATEGTAPVVVPLPAHDTTEVPSLFAPDEDRFITLAEQDGRILGYVGWNITNSTSGRLEMVAVHPDARRIGVARALCTAAITELQQRGIAVVPVGTGGDVFHASARALYESLGFIPYPTVDYARAI